MAAAYEVGGREFSALPLDSMDPSIGNAEKLLSDSPDGPATSRSLNGLVEFPGHVGGCGSHR